MSQKRINTAVTEVSTNNFKPLKPTSFKNRYPSGFPLNPLYISSYDKYSLPADVDMFYGYRSQVKAIEKAKATSLNYINGMIKDVELGIQKLKQYRADHYDDLNRTFLEANIRRLEKEMCIK